MDGYARERLTLGDFDPLLKVDAELPLDCVTPELYQALLRMEPFGVGNPEPVFTARGVRLMAPPQVMKDKHVKLRVAAALAGSSTIPNCHPDAAALPRESKNWRRAITYNALGWHMAQRFQDSRLLPGDTLDIAFTVGRNEHPDFGGLELSLRDFKLAAEVESKIKVVAASE